MRKSKRDEIFDSLEEIDNTSRLTPVSKKEKKKFSYLDESMEGDNKASKKKKRSLNKQFYIVTYFSVAVFLSLVGYIMYFTLFRSSEIINNPKNVRQDLYAKYVTRGKILDRDGEVLATNASEDENDNTRYYPYGSAFAHVVGYSAEKGNTGIEASNSFDLLSSNIFFMEKIKNNLAGKKNTGDNVVSTLDSDVQLAAANGLANSKGAAVAIEPKTGNIIAMYSNPGFDPNTIDQSWETLSLDEENSPLLNRATSGKYSPGSIFKTITSLEYIKENADYNNYDYICSGFIDYEDITIHCANDSVHGQEDIYTAFANSCNCAYASIGLQLDGDKLKETAEELLFNKKIYCPLPNVKSSFKADGKSSAGEMMMTAFGQGDTLTNPYHMALLTCAIANKGVLNKPKLVSQIQNYSGDVVKDYKTSSYKKLMSATHADILKTLMQGVVTTGTAMELNDLPYTAAGKTGTAEYSTSDKTKTHSWFMGFSNVEDPDLVVCVVVEDYDEDYYRRAVPIAKNMLEAYHNN